MTLTLCFTQCLNTQIKMKSNIEEVGEIVTQIISFKNGEKKTLKHVITKSISQSEFTKMDVTDGRRFSIQTKEVNWFESIPEKK